MDHDIPTRPQHTTSQPTHHILLTKIIVGTCGLLILCGLSFVSGIAYEKAHASQATSSTNAQQAQSGAINRLRTGTRPVRGQVTAVSSTSITIQNQRSGLTSTYAITSSTVIKNNGQAATATSIQTGDTVLVRVSTTSPTTASIIVIQPTSPNGTGTPPPQPAAGVTLN